MACAETFLSSVVVRPNFKVSLVLASQRSLPQVAGAVRRSFDYGSGPTTPTCLPQSLTASRQTPGFRLNTASQGSHSPNLSFLSSPTSPPLPRCVTTLASTDSVTGICIHLSHSRSPFYYCTSYRRMPAFSRSLSVGPRHGYIV
jgi:hypothetical protein